VDLAVMMGLGKSKSYLKKILKKNRKKEKKKKKGGKKREKNTCSNRYAAVNMARGEGICLRPVSYLGN
jgi:hypothetical protein